MAWRRQATRHYLSHSWRWHSSVAAIWHLNHRQLDYLFIEHTNISWWRHQMEAFSALLAICAGNSPVPGEFPTQRPVTRSFDVYFYLRPNKRLSKQSWGWWFATQSRPLWRHRNVLRGINPHHKQSLMWNWMSLLWRHHVFACFRRSITRTIAYRFIVNQILHCCDAIMGAMTSQIISLTIVYSTFHSGADQRKYQSSASLAFVREIHQWPVNSPYKWPVTRRMFPCDDVIMTEETYISPAGWSWITSC